MISIKDRLQSLYPHCFDEVNQKVEALIEKWKGSGSYPWVTNEDIMMITYGDGIKKEGEAPLKTLKTFIDKELKDLLSAVHLLPMFPYTSDDGFSVTDFRQINPELGSWEDIEALGECYDLMFDGVINHVSKSSEYFQGYLKGEQAYKEFFIEEDPNKDFTMVTRPRTLPLLTAFDTPGGKKYIWTTFSEDQIDLNYKNPEVLLEILDVLLLYANKGARFIRFDAIGFAWKEDGTTCMHLPQVHEMVKLMRQVLECCVSGCTIITETNVPHKDNISYFGNGFDEAGLVYQFPLPPLTLYSYLSGSGKELSKWAASLEPTSNATTYFNFLASHDGIGMRPVEDILDEQQKKFMAEQVEKRGGKISYRTLPDNRQVPYELNINYMDAIAGDQTENESLIQKYLSSQCVLLSVIGMPGIYYHSLLGSRNCYKDLEESGINRRINREKLQAESLNGELENPSSLRRLVLDRYCEMIRIRKREKAFSPGSPQSVIFLDDHLFTFIRGTGTDSILVVINVSDQRIELETSYHGTDLFRERKYHNHIEVNPYEYLWIRLESEV